MSTPRLWWPFGIFRHVITQGVQKTGGTGNGNPIDRLTGVAIRCLIQELDNDPGLSIECCQLLCAYNMQYPLSQGNSPNTTKAPQSNATS